MNELKTFNHQMFGELPLILVDGKEYFSATEITVGNRVMKLKKQLIFQSYFSLVFQSNCQVVV